MRAAARDVPERDAELARQAARGRRGERRRCRAGAPASPAAAARPLPAAASGSSIDERRPDVDAVALGGAQPRHDAGGRATAARRSPCRSGSRRGPGARGRGRRRPRARRRRRPSAMPSPTSGSRNSTGATSGLQRGPDAAPGRARPTGRSGPRPSPAGTARRAPPRGRSAPAATRTPPPGSSRRARRRTRRSAAPRARRAPARCARPPRAARRRRAARGCAGRARRPTALGGRALRRLLGDDHGRAVGDDGQVVALAHHAGLPERRRCSPPRAPRP